MVDPPEDPSAFVHAVGIDYFGPEEPFCLLDLPRELRDMIYEQMLVRDRIAIKPGYPWGDKAKGNPGRFDLRTRGRQRTMYALTRTDSLKFGSYEERKEGSRSYKTWPNLNIFLTNRQVYNESSSIYYKKNTFAFVGTYSQANEVLSVSACHAFLQDRPRLALQRLRSIHIEINSSAVSHPAADVLDGDLVVPLVEFIKDNLSLNCFSLRMDGWPPDMRSVPWDWNGRCVGCPGSPTKWLGAFAMLDNLKSLSIKLIASADPKDGDCDSLITCASFLRSKMLRNGASLGTERIHAYRRHHCSRYYESDGKPVDIWQRHPRRVYVVKCFDNEHGKSLLPPKSRRFASFPGLKAKRVAKGHDEASVKKALRDAMDQHPHQNLANIRIFCDNEGDDDEVEPLGDEKKDLLRNCVDYDLSDDGSDDSLCSLNLNEMDLEYVRDDEYFDNFEELGIIWRRRHGIADKANNGKLKNPGTLVLQPGHAPKL